MSSSSKVVRVGNENQRDGEASTMPDRSIDSLHKYIIAASTAGDYVVMDHGVEEKLRSVTNMKLSWPKASSFAAGGIVIFYSDTTKTVHALQHDVKRSKRASADSKAAFDATMDKLAARLPGADKTFKNVITQAMLRATEDLEAAPEHFFNIIARFAPATVEQMRAQFRLVPGTVDCGHTKPIVSTEAKEIIMYHTAKDKAKLAKAAEKKFVAVSSAALLAEIDKESKSAAAAAASAAEKLEEVKKSTIARKRYNDPEEGGWGASGFPSSAAAAAAAAAAAPSKKRRLGFFGSDDEEEEAAASPLKRARHS